MVCQVFCLPEFFFWIVKAGPLKRHHSMNETQMTLTERNQKLFELRHKLAMKRAEIKMIEQEMCMVRDVYEKQRFQDTPLFDEMFGG